MSETAINEGVDDVCVLLMDAIPVPWLTFGHFIDSTILLAPSPLPLIAPAATGSLLTMSTLEYPSWRSERRDTLRTLAVPVVSRVF